MNATLPVPTPDVGSSVSHSASLSTVQAHSGVLVVTVKLPEPPDGG